MILNAFMRWLKPHEMAFFDMLESSADNAAKAAGLVLDGLKGGAGDWAELRRGMKELEHQGDEITHGILDRLDRTFVTPLEKEDIQHLAHVLDDIVDGLDAICERLTIYRIQGVRPALVELAQVALEGCQELAVLMRDLRSLSNPEGSRTRIRRIKELENRSDAIFHEALADLFQGTTDPIELLKWKELLDTMERCVDAIDHAAKVVGSTVMKNA